MSFGEVTITEEMFGGTRVVTDFGRLAQLVERSPYKA